MKSGFSMPLPDIDDIRAAASRIASHAVRTPLLESPQINDILGGRLLVKAETLQRTGSFKFRGAFNTIAQIPNNIRKNGIVAFSSGNHAQGVAAAALLHGVPAVIVMPKDAPGLKVANTIDYGAEVILYNRYTEDREAIAAGIAEKRGLSLVKPYDDPRVIAGQGTVGLEIIEQIDTPPDQVLAPCGGGGLISGTAIAIKDAAPDSCIYAVEPEEFDDTARSLKLQSRQKVGPEANSICDSLMPATPGEITFAINQRILSGGLVVSDNEVRQAMREGFLRLKLIIEPGGAVGLAAVLSGIVDCRNKITVVVCSGGNVDPSLFSEILGES